MKRKVTLLHRAGGLIVLVILWVVGTLFCALGVTFLPVVGVFFGLSIILVGTWFGFGLTWPELFAPLEPDLYELGQEALRRDVVLGSAVVDGMMEEQEIDPEISEAA
jgi:hypothetical protein